MFDPSSLTPPANYVDYIENNKHHNLFQSATFWAQWGAAQAVEALKLQMPTDGIRDRPPTEADGDLYKGQVQILEYGYWRNTHWTSVASNHCGALKTDGDRPDLLPWLHTPSWRPKPELTPNERALALLDSKDFDTDFTAEQIALLRQVVKSADPKPVKTTPTTPLTIGGHVVKPGDRLTLRNNEVVTAHEISWGDDLWQVSCQDPNLVKRYRYLSVYANGINPFNRELDILAVK
jgi:hypothetical protein